MTDDLKKLLGPELTTQVETKLGEGNDLFFHKTSDKVVISNSGEWLPKAKFDEKNEEVKSLKEQIGTFTTEVESLKKSGKNSAELNEKITELQGKLTEREKENALMVKKVALREALTEAGAKHPDLLEAKFDLNKLELDDKGAIKDLDNHIKPVKESYKDLFGEVKRVGKSPEKGEATPAEYYTKEELQSMSSADVAKDIVKVNKSLEFHNKN